MSPALGEAPLPLRPDDSFRQAARAAMWPQVERLLALEPALRGGDDTNDLKRYRVATRRIRAALRVFAGALPKRRVDAVRPELGDLARGAGRVRDLDVRIAGLAAWAADRGSPASDDVEPLRAAWTAERAEAAAEMLHRLTTRRHARLLDGLARLLGDHTEDERSQGGAIAVRDRAGSATWAAFELLRAGASDLVDPDLETLHDLRIRAKRFRYTLEFLAPVLGGDSVWLIARLVELQDHLGALNDADLAGGAARAFLDDAGARLTGPQREIIEAYAAGRSETVERLRGLTRRSIAPLLAPTFARRLSRAILGPEPPKAALAGGSGR